MAATGKGSGQSKFLNPDAREAVDPRRCRVCGNLTLSPVRRAGRAVLWAVIGALLLYIALDIYENGALDGSLYTALRRGDLRPAAQRIVP
jgi:hypothetical protein